MQFVLALALAAAPAVPNDDLKRTVAAIEETLRSHDRGDGLGDAVVRSACRVARDPRSASVALAFAVGGIDLRAAGVPDRPTRAGRVRASRATLHGRHDWLRHFVVAAALAHTSGPTAAEWAAVHKERSDEREGGSGFDVSDLQAGISGIAFAAWLGDPGALAACARRFTGSRFVPALRGVRKPDGRTLQPLRDAARRTLRSALRSSP